jgi:hypothetical protein
MIAPKATVESEGLDVTTKRPTGRDRPALKEAV